MDDICTAVLRVIVGVIVLFVLWIVGGAIVR